MPREIRIIIPDDFDFTWLHMQRDPQTGEVELAWLPFEAILRLSGVDPLLVLQDDNLLALLLMRLYEAHRDMGRARDWVQEGILAEIAAERDHGARVQRASSRLQ